MASSDLSSNAIATQVPSNVLYKINVFENILKYIDHKCIVLGMLKSSLTLVWRANMQKYRNLSGLNTFLCLNKLSFSSLLTVISLIWYLGYCVYQNAVSDVRRYVLHYQILPRSYVLKILKIFSRLSINIAVASLVSAVCSILLMATYTNRSLE